ncbi:hypothetical protein IAR50_005986 [Cryptococcus sp. DSM 104548]
MVELTSLSETLSDADFTSIPIIDLTDAQSPDGEKRRAVAMDIREACLNAGFFYIKNYGVAEEIVDATFTQSKKFFDAPAEIKKSVDITKSENFRGYMGLLVSNNDPSTKGDMYEAFNLGLDPSIDPSLLSQTVKEGELKHSENLWPSTDVWNEAGEFTKHPAAIMRLLFYPALGEKEVDELMPGIGSHTDFECFTILRQSYCDVPSALQVQNRKGQWINAPYIPGTFVINIGDQFARWTNDIFVSTRHRVLPALANDRYSIPFFFGCDHDVPLVPPATCVTAERPARYPVVTAGAYVFDRLSKAYRVEKSNV